MCRTSHPLCRLKNPTVVYLITCRLSSSKTGVHNVHLLIILEREGVAISTKKGCEFLPTLFQIFQELCVRHWMTMNVVAALEKSLSPTCVLQVAGKGEDRPS